MRPSTLVGFLVVLAVTAGCSSPTGTPQTQVASTSPTPAASVPPSLAASVPPGAPEEDIRYFNEWPSPNNGLYNTRVAHSTISTTNVSKLAAAWTLPLTGLGATGRDFANPVIANGVVYLQDGASNVMAVSSSTGKIIWTHMYSSMDYGPNGVTLAYGRIYGVTASGVFALDAATGHQVWYDASFAGGKAKFDIAPQVANDKVFVASALTPGGGLIYALDAGTGATEWSFQTVADTTGQQLKATAGGAWDPFLIGPDGSLYVGTGNPYLSQQQAQTNPSRELYTDSIVKLSQATGRVEWYYQAFPDDFHDWDLQISPVLTVVAGRSTVLAAGKGGFVFALDPASGALLWKTAVGIHNAHDQDDELALEGKLQLQTPYIVYPGEAGGVETNMAVADGVAYVPVVDLGTTYTKPTVVVGTSDFLHASGEMVALDVATGRQLWTAMLQQAPYGGATVAGDLVFTTTFTGELVALSRTDGSIAWTAQLPAGSNSTLAIAGDTLIAGAGLPLSTTQQPAVMAYRLGH
ncbi:MAG TPA: PQQ-binding-like beta-propeller repeat protein [Candidatus Dormibacteraeota bacterium]|nr:PQQ-binding-like beta-propeller repeat protein [Candidatus Dormibacteraeota bacterium]